MTKEPIPSHLKISLYLRSMFHLYCSVLSYEFNFGFIDDLVLVMDINKEGIDCTLSTISGTHQ